MPQAPKGASSWSLNPFRMTTMYLLLGLTWIVLSDQIVGLTQGESPTAVRLHVLKGFAFVVVTATFLFYVLDRFVRAQHERDDVILRESDARSQAETYLDVVDVMILALDPKGSVVMINRKGREILGYPEEDIVGKDWISNFLPERFKKETRVVLKKTLTGKRDVAHHENPILTRSGEERMIRWHNSTITDVHGHIIGSLSSGEDVTEEYGAHEQTERLERQHRRVLESVADGIFGMDADGRVTFANSTAAHILGRRLDELVGRDIREFVCGDGGTPGSKDDDCPILASIHEGVAMKSARTTFRKADGTEVPVEFESSSFREEGRIVGTVLVFRDFTEQSKAEEQIEAERRKYQELVENLAVGIYRNTPGRHGVFLEANAETLALFEADVREDFMRRSVSDLYVNPSQRKDFSDKLLKNGFVKNEEIQLKTMKGREFWASVTAVMKEDAVRGVYFDCAIMDVTKKVEAEHRVKELNDLRNRFIQIVSHQLRTPLNVIRWNLENLLSDELGKLKVPQREILRVSYAADVDVISRINDLLMTMDIEEGRMVNVSKAPASFRGLWQSVSVEWIPFCETKGITCSTSVAKDVPAEVSMDSRRIRTVMQHLANNAATYTHEGGKVTVQLTRVDSKVRFEIADTGIGIPEDEQKRIFARFYRATNAMGMKADASGLGLYLSQHIIEQHGGTIGFASDEGKGSAFWFEIPIA
ncbi:MAG: PAS domain-containing sensor histidine kinase [Patescibacteria group bacterium]